MILDHTERNDQGINFVMAPNPGHRFYGRLEQPDHSGDRSIVGVTGDLFALSNTRARLEVVKKVKRGNLEPLLKYVIQDGTNGLIAAREVSPRRQEKLGDYGMTLIAGRDKFAVLSLMEVKVDPLTGQIEQPFAA